MIDMETSTDPREKRWNELYDETLEEQESENDEEHLPPPAETNPWQIGAGALVMMAGVVLPALTISVGAVYSFEGIWRLTLLHPLETLIETLLILAVPFANCKAWYALCHKDSRNPVRLGIFNGIAIAVPAITLSIAIASFALNYPLIDSLNGQSHSLTVGLMGVLSIPALFVGLYLTHLLRTAKQTRDARIRTVLYSLLGVGLTLVSLVGAEFRSAYIRIAQTYALSDDATQREKGLSILRGATPEKELKMVCADQHAAGLAGMFLPLDANSQKRLYFASIGKPYRDRQSTNMSLMSNDYLHNHVVGAQIDGLTLHRSSITGNVHPKTLSSTIDWTFVFKNRSYMNQEARAELALPEGAVISNLTLWINGQAQSGAFSANENSGVPSTTFRTSNYPAVITDLGRGRYLLQASPIPGQGEMKVQVSITEPLKLDGGNVASLGVPRFVDSNFALAGEHNITLRCDDKLVSGLKSIKPSVTADGVSILSGHLKEEDISNAAFSIRLEKSIEFNSVAVKDPFNANSTIFEQLKTRNANPPKHLVVVVDSSQAMKGHVDEVVAAICKIPGQIDTTILLAGDSESVEPLGKEEGIKKLKENHFGGGQDNLLALVRAAEHAGESTGGAVLWIHGPQPGYNNEMYLINPYAAPPKFFEMALDDCLTDVNEFFKNHKEVGPFAAIPRTGPLGDDLQNFLSKWQPGAKETYTDFSTQKIGNAQEIEDSQASREVAILNASRNVQELLAHGKTSPAAQIGVLYHIVTPVSGVVVPDQTTINASAPMLQGATNGTVTPQGADATVIQGINTSGTVRVNNLANLEALLNIFANFGEIAGIALGGFNIVVGAMGKSMFFPFKLSSRGRIVCGLAVMVLGLALPGCLNWLVASARDANLFE